MLDLNEICFSFDKNEEINNFKNNLNNKIFTYLQITPYNKEKSTLYKKINDLNGFEDGFYLYQYITYNAQLNDIFNSATFLRFIYNNNIKEENIYGKIGLNMNNYKDISCPRFISSLKEQKIIKKYIFTFDFYSRFDGYFYVGIEPHLYNMKNNINKEYQYVKMNSILSKEGYVQWNILFNKIVVKNGTNSMGYSLNNKLVKIDFNLGLIIGTSEYQEIIEQNFFNNLIDKDICKKALVEYNLNNIENSKSKYYVYNCNEQIHQRIKRNLHSYYDSFPEMQFFHIDLQNSLKLFKHELFEEISGHYYFLIIFEAEKNNSIWKLGQPFLKPHEFIFDFDSKTIGYYDINIYKRAENKKTKKIKDVVEEKININNNITNDKKYINNNNKSINSIKDIISSIIKYIIIGIIIIVAFYLGMKIKQSRKKKANELKDDDYEYISHNNNINDDNNNKISKNIELNKMGV